VRCCQATAKLKGFNLRSMFILHAPVELINEANLHLLASLVSSR